jgi:hypothetical protein
VSDQRAGCERDDTDRRDDDEQPAVMDARRDARSCHIRDRINSTQGQIVLTFCVRSLWRMAAHASTLLPGGH